MKIQFDVDIDFADRSKVLEILDHVPASINHNGEWVKHNTGIYVTDIPLDPINQYASIDYKEAEELGYFKLDLLNVSVYELVRDEAHLLELMGMTPPWERLYDQSFCSGIVHIGQHYNTLLKMPEVVDSIPRLAMFLSVIRPAKRHLIGLPWREVAKTIWDKPSDGGYYFKKSHAVSYSHLVAIHMNLNANP